MSVLKSKRKASQFEVFHHFYKMRKEVTDLLLRDFGFDLERAIKNISKKFFGGRPYEELIPEEKDRYDKLVEKDIAFAEWFIKDERQAVVDCLRSIGEEVFTANSIYPTYMEELLEEIIEIAGELGITVNRKKTRICKLSEHWQFLQVQYSLTETGRVIQKINPKRLTGMRRKMKKLAPKMTEKEFTDWYQSWFQNHYRIMSKQQRANMDKLFNQLKEVTKCRTQSHSQMDGS